MVTTRIDHVVIAVADLALAAERYTTLLGRRPAWQGAHPVYQTRNVLFDLDPYIELLGAQPQASSPLADWVRAAVRSRSERPMMIALAVDDIDAAVQQLRAQAVEVSDAIAGEGVDANTQQRRTWRNAVVDPRSARGLRLLLIAHDAASPALPPQVAQAGAVRGVDHLVIFTADAEAAAAWWIKHCDAQFTGRHHFPERRTKNVLLTLGGVIVECIEPLESEKPLHADIFWGVAYRVDDIEAATGRLHDAGLAVDKPRTGLAPQTRVATLRWDGAPTLLIERRDS
jgi:catechol 2,3-dioxygenase-like lactoylglutathione lyase family enzyme